MLRPAETDPARVVHDFGNDALQPVVVPPYPGLHSVQIIVIRIPEAVEAKKVKEIAVK